MSGSESGGRSKEIRAVRATGKATWWVGKGTVKTAGRLAGATKTGMGTAGRKTLGPDKYRRQVDDVNTSLSDSLQKLEAVLNRQQQRINELETELARERGSDK